MVGLLGPNGAGKTTSFYMIVGLISPDSGRILVDDRTSPAADVPARPRAASAICRRKPSVFRKLTVEENLMAILETLPLRGARAPRDHGAADRSAGPRRRCAAAAATCCRAASGGAWRSRVRW